MGIKGSKKGPEVDDVAADLVEKLAPLGDLTTKSMFGGIGVFESGTMFCAIDSKGRPSLRADDQTEPDFLAARSSRHGRMPYYEIPEVVLADPDVLRDWAQRAIEASRRAKKG